MDLISRKAAIDQAMGRANYVDTIFDKPTECEIVYMLRSIPSVPAVPLDKLCEWLNKNQGELPHCPFDDDCYECGLDGVACIKKRIKAWMEGLDAEVH